MVGGKTRPPKTSLNKKKFGSQPQRHNELQTCLWWWNNFKSNIILFLSPPRSSKVDISTEKLGCAPHRSMMHQGELRNYCQHETRLHSAVTSIRYTDTRHSFMYIASMLDHMYLDCIIFIVSLHHCKRSQSKQNLLYIGLLVQ